MLIITLRNRNSDSVTVQEEQGDEGGHQIGEWNGEPDAGKPPVSRKKAQGGD